MIFGSKKKEPKSAATPDVNSEAENSQPAPQSPQQQAANSVAAALSGGAAGAAPAAPEPAPAPALDQDGLNSNERGPEVSAKIAAIRVKLHETFGKVTLAMMAVPRYRNLSLSDLGALVLDPLMRDRIAIASSAKDGEVQEGSLSGIAIWASVSPEVDAKIREQIKAGTFPIRLKPEDWTSGNINWLLDVIAPNQRLTTSVIANFRQVVKEGDMRMHPIITRLVDPEALKKMGAQPIKTDQLAGDDRAPVVPPPGTPTH